MNEFIEENGIFISEDCLLTEEADSEIEIEFIEMYGSDKN